MKRTLCLILCLCFALGLSVTAAADSQIITTPASGYTAAEQVDYEIYTGPVKVNSNTVNVTDVVVNWGARGEDATFLSTYAQEYYVNEYTWENLSSLAGGTGTSDAYESALYKGLQDMMKAHHAKITNYQETRAYYGFTDCVRNDYSQLSSFYSGRIISSLWNGSTYNREHTWPNSKGLGGNDENDIMMLRPTVSSENSSRGNTAYGESAGYFDPGVSVRGDCARIVLYTYVRWGNTSYMWGKSGVMESMDVLLKWMEEDPVDTWEMGRNDSVESITGVRNVFVDFPELAWLLFGREVPEDITTPSGSTKAEPAPTDPPTEPSTAPATQPSEEPTATDPAPTEPPVDSPNSNGWILPVVLLLGGSAALIFILKKRTA